MSNTNPFVSDSPIDTMDKCKSVLNVLLDAQPRVGEPVSEEENAGRQLIFIGIMEALDYTAECLNKSGGEA